VQIVCSLEVCFQTAVSKVESHAHTICSATRYLFG
jgi:hypothetical protein